MLRTFDTTAVQLPLGKPIRKDATPKPEWTPIGNGFERNAQGQLRTNVAPPAAAPGLGTWPFLTPAKPAPAVPDPLAYIVLLDHFNNTTGTTYLGGFEVVWATLV